MKKPQPKMTPGHYWIASEREVTILVEYYLNPDVGPNGEWGFGFGIADG